MIRRPPRSTLFPYTTRCRARRTDRWLRAAPRTLRPAAGLAREHAQSEARAGLGEEPGPAGEDRCAGCPPADPVRRDRKSTRLNSRHAKLSYPVFCLTNKNET